MSLSGTWLAKAEYAFSTLNAQQVSQAPKLLTTGPRPQDLSSYLFNGMINPIIPYAINGVIWYQGESNAERAYQYRTSFPLMIEDWRNRWNRGNFPFYFVQLANYKDKVTEPVESSWAELREAQNLTLAQPKTGQAVIIDLGESGDVHPRNKTLVGERLARIALANEYGQAIPYSGPVYDSMTIKNDKVILHFSQTEGGLVAQSIPDTYIVQSESGKTDPLIRNSPESELEGFSICGSDRKWVWAQACIEGNSVVVWSDEVEKPIAVRYAWANNPTCNLYNGAGLPASPFRTDDFPPITKDTYY
jgi:sialate O-acetylesterase